MENRTPSSEEQPIPRVHKKIAKLKPWQRRLFETFYAGFLRATLQVCLEKPS